MLGLSSKRFVPVLLKSSSQKPVLINPFAYQTLVRESEFLKEQAELSQDQWEAKEHFFERAAKIRKPARVPDNWSDLVAIASELSLEAVNLPCVADEKIHVQSLKGLKVGVTDLYDPKWSTVNIGSSRNALLSETQLKGCGRTLPVNSFWHRLSSGTCLIRETVHSFIVTQLIQASLPLGSVPCLAAYFDTESDDGKSLYLRAANFIRISQIPERPEPDEIKNMREMLSAYHPGCSAEEIIKRVMAQYASNAFLGATLQSTPDNLLLDGRPIDEEDWEWPRKPGHEMISIQFYWKEGEVPGEKTPLDFPWEKVEKFQTTFQIYEKSISLYLEGLNQVIPHAITLDEAWNKFVDHLASIWSYYGQDPALVRSKWNEGRKISKGEEIQTWIKKFTSGWSHIFGNPKTPDKYYFTLSPAPIMNMNLLSYKSFGLALEGNQKLGVFSNNSFPLTRKLLSVAARFSHCFPVTVNLKGETVPNQMALQDWWEKEKKTFQGWEERVTAFLYLDEAGEEHRISVKGSVLDANSIQSKKIVPLAVVISMKEGELEIPARKVFLHV